MSVQAHLMHWYAIGLRENPFPALNAATEPDIGHYFVSIGGLNIYGVLDVQDGFIILGERGCGKTACRRMIANLIETEQQGSKLLAVEYTHQALRQVPANIEPGQEVSMHTRAIAAQVEASLAAQTQYQKQKLETESLDPYVRLDKCAEALRSMGFDRCLILVDDIDELDELKGDTTKMAAYLAPLLRLASKQVDGITFHFFLPSQVFRQPAIQNDPFIRLDRFRIRELNWGKKELQNLLKQRLVHFSLNQAVPLQNLGQLCSDDSNSEALPLSRVIDNEVIDMVLPARQKARAIVDLAGRLLEQHIANQSTTRITQEEWHAVRDDWLCNRASFFGFADQVLRLVGDQFVYQHRPVELPTRNLHLLLKCLHQANGEPVTHKQLIQAGWPEVENTTAVSPDALKQAMLRLRKALEELNIQGANIQNLRGTGYRLTWM